MNVSRVQLRESVDLKDLQKRAEAAGGKFQLLSTRGPGGGPLVKLTFDDDEAARRFATTISGFLQEGKLPPDTMSSGVKSKYTRGFLKGERATIRALGKGDIVSGHGADWKVEMMLQNGGMVARDINTGDLHKFGAQEAEQFTKVMGVWGQPEGVPVIDPGSDLSPLEQHAELMSPEQLDAFISGGHDLSKVHKKPRQEHCGHCPEDFAKWVKRFPEDDDASYQARLEKAANVGFEGLEDEELTPAGIARKRAVYREGHYESALGAIKRMVPENEDDYEPIEGNEGEQAQYGPGDDIDVEVGDRVNSSYGKLWITGTGVVGDLWTSHDPVDIESGRGRGLRFSYVSAVQKQGRGPWYQVHYDRDSGMYTVKTNVLDVVTLRDENDNPLMRRDDPKFDQALQASCPEGATNAYFLDVGNDDGALIAFTCGPVSPGEIVQALSGPEYGDVFQGVELKPSQVQALESISDESWDPKRRTATFRSSAQQLIKNKRASASYIRGRIRKNKDPLKAFGYEKDLKAFEAEWSNDEEYKRAQGDWVPDEQPGADPMADEPSALSGDTEGLDPHETNFLHGQGYSNINRRGLTPEKVVRIDSFGDVDFGAENYREFGKYVKLPHDKLQYLEPSPVGGSIQREESVEKLVHNLLGESTVEMTVTRVDANDQEFEIPVEVELDMIPGSRGARDSLGGRRGAGPPLEPDEPATAEVTRVTVLDDGLAAMFPNLELTPDEEERAIEQAVEAAADWY